MVRKIDMFFVMMIFRLKCGEKGEEELRLGWFGGIIFFFI